MPVAVKIKPFNFIVQQVETTEMLGIQTIHYNLRHFAEEKLSLSVWSVYFTGNDVKHDILRQEAKEYVSSLNLCRPNVFKKKMPFWDF